jgi:hypothetical protein
MWKIIRETEASEAKLLEMAGDEIERQIEMTNRTLDNVMKNIGQNMPFVLMIARLVKEISQANQPKVGECGYGNVAVKEEL